MECNFTYEHYIETIEKFKKTYKFTTYGNSSTNDIILRHDVDTSLVAALKMAKIENKLKISSTYFIYFSSEFYNTFGENSFRLIEEILKLGHRIGLHYNENFIMQNNLDPTEAIITQIKFLEYHFKTKIEAIAAHEANTFPPSMKIHLPKNIFNAYSDEFVKDRKYLSDSAMFWREGCFCNHYDKFQKLQILIHPMWWNQEKMSREEIMNLFLDGEYNLYSNLIKSDRKKHEEWAAVIANSDPRINNL